MSWNRFESRLNVKNVIDWFNHGSQTDKKSTKQQSNLELKQENISKQVKDIKPNQGMLLNILKSILNG